MVRKLLILAATLAEFGWAQDKTVTLTHGGQSRSYLLHLPTGYDSTAALPLVLDFHGLSGTSSQQAGFTGFRAQADKAKLLVAWPQGIGNSWNAGSCCGTAQSGGVDDVGFAKAVVAHISSTHRVDARRVYATGFSNGGMFTYRLASQATDVFAAGAICAGALLSGITSPRPIALIAIHGYDDEALPYESRTPTTFKSWSTFDKCEGNPVVETLSGRNKCETYTTCQAGVEVALCSIEGTHAIYSNSVDFPVAERAWAFLSRFTLPSGTAVLPPQRSAARKSSEVSALVSEARVPLLGGYLPDGREPAGKPFVVKRKMQNKSLVRTGLALVAIHIHPAFAQNNINYAGTGQVAHTLNIYKPSGTGPFPVVINYGGQAFSWGDTKSDGGLASSFNAAGIAVVGANLSGGGTGTNLARYPAQIQELKATVRFLRANAKTYNLNPNFIGVTGFSSGAWNTVILATTGDVDEHKIGNTTMKLEGTFGLHHDVSSRVQAGWASAAPTDFSKMDGCGSSINHGSATSPEGNLIGGALATLPDNVQLANPINYVSKDDPPLYLRHGSSDNVVPTCQSVLLWDAIKAIDNKKDMNYTAVSGGHAPNTSGILPFFQKAIQNNKEGCLDPKHARFDPMATFCSTGDCCAATTALPGESGKPLFSIIAENSPGRNPSAGIVFVTTTGAHRLRVFDVGGMEILSASGRGHAEYVMGALNPGVYFVSVATATAAQSRRFLKF